MHRHDLVLNYWFGTTDLNEPVEPAHQEIWFGKADETDRSIREHFVPDIARAAAGELVHWEAQPGSALALVLVLDQFPRNAFRDTAGMFAYDVHGLRVARGAIERGFDGDVSPERRTFFYLPLMHSEALEDQDRCVALFEAMVAAASPDAAERAAQGLQFAHLHRDIILRFGRYPHRNAILGREPTPEEVHFLTQPNSSF